MSHPLDQLEAFELGTLTENEQREVAAHVESCEQCQAEVQSLREVRQQIRAAFESDAVPTPAARRRVMENIARLENPVAPVEHKSSRAASAPSLLDRIAAALQSLMAPKWAPAAAVVLIAVQGSLLLWPAQQTVTPVPTSTNQQRPLETPRSLEKPSARIHVRFAPTATEADIRALLKEVFGEIVKGPDADGEYVIKVLANNAEHAASKVTKLRERTTIVQSAELEQP